MAQNGKGDGRRPMAVSDQTMTDNWALAFGNKKKPASEGEGLERALIVDQPWVNLILSEEKIWEMRSRPTKIRGRIGLIEKGTGLIVGEVEIVDSLPPLTKNHQRIKSRPMHRILPAQLHLMEKWCYPWVLANAKRYEKPIPYNHPKGAVTWVKL